MEKNKDKVSKNTQMMNDDALNKRSFVFIITVL